MLVAAITFAALTGLVSVTVAREPEVSTLERVVSAGSTLIAGLVVGVVVVIFTRLHVRADREGVRFGFGPFASKVGLDGIIEARPVPYRWMRYGGWGLRSSWNFRDRAYSVPFVKHGVEIQLDNGRSFFVSSRHPEALARAIESLTGRGGPLAAL
jgi:hypothetical protein